MALLSLISAPLALKLGAPAPIVPAVSSPQPSPVATAASRRVLLQGALGATVAALAEVPLPAVADVRGANQGLPTNERDVNKYLANLGLSPLKVPGGFNPLIQYIGTAPPANIDGQKVKARPFRDSMLVRFVYPSGWIVETPSIDENGEAGNIGANNYIKGDSCNFAALSLPSGETLSSLKKDFFTAWLSSQMSSDVYEDIKIKKIKPMTQADGTESVKFEFTYTLLTRAGFTVLRSGIATALVSNDAVVGVVAATTQLRYKEQMGNLDIICDSFRASAAKPPAFDVSTGLS